MSLLQQRFRIFALLFACLALFSCAQAVPGTLVDTAGRVAHVADDAAAAVVKSLTAGAQAGTVSAATAQVYVDKIAPKVQASLDDLKAVLLMLKTSPSTITAAQVAGAIALVQEAIATAQAFGAAPADWSKLHGGTPSVTPP
jgi:hypothetical protein